MSHPNFEFHKLIKKFRICDHNLEIKLDRYKKVPRNLRIGNFCKYSNIDDEFHFFFHCERNCNVRIFFLSEFNFEKEATQLSEIVRKLINSEPNRFSAGSKYWLFSQAFN